MKDPIAIEIAQYLGEVVRLDLSTQTTTIGRIATVDDEIVQVISTPRRDGEELEPIHITLRTPDVVAVFVFDHVKRRQPR